MLIRHIGPYDNNHAKYGIVSQSGGFVCVYSTPGQGTAFHVYLSRVESESATVLTPPEAEAVLSGTETVLLVEDEAIVRRLTTHMLRSAGYKVLSAANGQAGLAIVEQGGESIALVLTDVVMPHMTGPELAQILSRTHPQIPVLFMSGYPDHPSLHTRPPRENAGLLSKPFGKRELLRRVRAAIDGRADAL